MRKLSIIFFTFLASALYAQETDMWKILSDVRYESKRTGKDEFEMDVPTFGKRLSSWDGKKIILKGYLIPLSEFGGKGEFMLSSLPFSNCFFCGGAGPETIVELQTKQSVKFTTARIALEGILLLNDNDPDHHMYILKEVTLVD
jgi:hypothetical protein